MRAELGRDVLFFSASMSVSVKGELGIGEQLRPCITPSFQAISSCSSPATETKLVCTRNGIVVLDILAIDRSPLHVGLSLADLESYPHQDGKMATYSDHKIP